MTVPDDALLEGQRVAVITAASPTIASGFKNVTVTDNETATLALTLPALITEGTSVSTASVSLSAAPAVPVVVNLSSMDAVISLPESVTVPGGMTSASFTVTAVDDEWINAARTVEITASMVGLTSATSSLAVTDDEADQLELTIDESVFEGTSRSCTVTLPFDVSEDTTVQLVSSHPLKFAVPESVIIHAGSRMAEFAIEAIDDSAYQPTTDVTVTASGTGLATGSAVTHLINDDAHHFEFTTIASHTTDEPTSVILSAKDEAGHTLMAFHGDVELTAVGDVGPIMMDPPTVSGLEFIDGVWAANVSLYDSGLGIKLHATQGSITGESNAFNLTTVGAFNGFSFSEIASPQTRDVPFPLTLTARDEFGYRLTTFNSPVMLADSAQVVDVSNLPLGAADTVMRVQYVYGPEMVGSARTLTSISLQLTEPMEFDTGAITVRMKHTDKVSFDLPESQLWESAGWTTVAVESVTPRPAGWVTLTLATPFAYDGVHSLMLDFSFNRDTARMFAVPSTCEPDDFIAHGIWFSGIGPSIGDPLTWSGAEPPPSTTSLQPRIRFNDFLSTARTAVAPAEVTLVNGVWSGNAAVSNGGSFHVMRASSGVFAGFSNYFDVDVIGTLTLTMPSLATEGGAPIEGIVAIGVSREVPTVVHLSSTNAAVAHPTAPTVTIPAGEMSAPFTVTVVDDTLLNGTRDLFIIGRADSFDGTTPPFEGALSVSDNDSTPLTLQLPVTLTEGQGSVVDGGTLTLGAAASYDIEVSLSSSDTTELNLPGGVIVPAGQTSVHFDVEVVDDLLADGPQMATVTAHVAGWADGTVGATVRDDDAHHFALSAVGSPQKAGVPFALTITAMDVAGQPLTAYASTPSLSAGMLPISTVALEPFANGVSQAQVSVDALGSNVVLTVDDASGATGSSNAFAVEAGAPMTFTFGIVGGPQTANVPFAATITARDQFGNVATGFTGTATINSIFESASTPANPMQTTAFVDGVWTGNVAVQKSGFQVKLTANAGAAYGESNNFSVVSLGSLSIALPSTAAEGNAPLSGTLTISSAPVADFEVNLSSSDTSAITVPATVTILAGQTTANFTATIPDDTLLEGPRSVLIVAAAPSYDSGLKTVQVADNETATITLTMPTTVTEGGAAGTATITLSDVAGGSVRVSLINSDTANLEAPESVIVVAGETTATFEVKAVDDELVDGSKPVTLAAHVDGWTDGSASTTVNDDETRGIHVVGPLELTEGGSELITVSLDGLAPADLTIALASTQAPRLALPTTVTIPAGESSVTEMVTLEVDDVYQASVAAVITASAATFISGSTSLDMINDDPHHYRVSYISSPKTVGGSFDVTITARDEADVLFHSFGDFSLSALSGARVMPLYPSGGSLFEGSWTGQVSLTDVGIHTVLHVTDVGGQTGASNEFDVEGGAGYAAQFAWDTLTSPQVVGVPFPVRIRAIDSEGFSVPAFNESVSLSLFETGAPASTWRQPLNTYFEDARTQSILTPADVGVERALTQMSMRVLTPPGQVMRRFTVRLKHTSKSDYSASNSQLFETTGWTMVYQGDLNVSQAGEVTVPFSQAFNYNGFENLLVDVSFNNTSFSTAGELESLYAEAPRSAFAVSDSTNGDPLNWSDGTVFPYVSSQMPLFWFNGQPSPLANANVTPRKVTFTNGEWIGTIKATRSGWFQTAASNDLVVGFGDLVEVTSSGTLAVTLPERATEGDAPVTGTVALPEASATATVITLATSDASEATPSVTTVTIPAGDTSATFTVNLPEDALLDGTQTALITASAPGYDVGSATLLVDDNEPATLTLTAPTFVSESAGVVTNAGTVTLSAAPASDVTVFLSSSNVLELTKPASVVIRAGTTSSTFALTAVDDADIDGSQNVTLTAHVANWTDGTSVVAVRDDELDHFALSAIASPQSVGVDFPLTLTAKTVDGFTLTDWSGDVQLTEMAGTSELGIIAYPITLTNGTWSGDAQVIYSGTAITVQADDLNGHIGTSNAFVVNAAPVYQFEWSAITGPVVANTPIAVTISARDEWGNVATGFTGTVQFSNFVTPNAVLPTRSGAFDGGVWSGSIRVGAAWVNQALVAFDDSEHSGASNSFTVTAGSALSLSLPSEATEGVAPVVGALSISAAPASDLTVNLESSATNAVTVPATVVIPAGMTSVPITVTVVDDTLLEGPQVAIVTAWAANAQSGTKLMVVVDDTETATLAITLPASVTEGQTAPVMGTVTVSEAPSVPVTVWLSNSNNQKVEPVSPVVIPPGQTSGSFVLPLIDNGLLDGPQTVTITAGVETWASANQALLINDDESRQIIVTGPTSIAENGAESIEVTIGGTAVADLTISLLSSLPGRLTLPATTVIPSGSSSVTVLAETPDNSLSDGDQNVVVTASADTLTAGIKTIRVIDDEPDHFTFATVPSLRTAGVGFDITVSAKNAAGQTLTSFEGVATLTAANTAGPLSETVFSPFDISFSGGVSTASVTVNGIVDAVVLTAQVGTTGPMGASNAFNVRAGALDHFEWSLVESPQIKDVPFDVTLTARDVNGYKVAGEDGLVDVYLNFTGSVGSTGEPINSFIDDMRTQCIYTPAEVGSARPLRSLSLHVVAPTTKALRNFTIRLKNTTLTYDDPANQVWQTAGWTTVLRRTLPPSTESGWRTFEFDAPFVYDGANLMVDFSFDNEEPGSGDELVFSAALGGRVLVAQSSSTDGDPLTWDYVTPLPILGSMVPRVKFDDFLGRYDGNLKPSEVRLTNGEWTGSLTPLVAGFGLQLWAEQGGVSGVSDLIDFNTLGALTLTLPISAPEGAGLINASVSIPEARAVPVIVSLRSASPALSLPANAAVIPAGETSATFRVRVLDDTLLNGTRPVEVFASALSYDDASGAINVMDNETATLSIDRPTVTLVEGGYAMFTVHSSKAPDADVVFEMEASNSALAFFGPFIMPAGETSTTVFASIQDDAINNGTRSVVVTAHVENWTDGLTAVLVHDNEAASFVVSSVTSPQAAGVPFAVTVVAATTDGQPLVDYHRNVTLTASAGSTVLATLNIGANAFINGVWTGNVTINTTATDVILTVSDTPGATGQSNSFEVLAGPLHHFAWNTVSSPQLVNTPFNTTVTAKDQFNNTVSAFAGTTSLSTVGGVSTSVSGTGTFSWAYPLYTYYHDARTQSIYTPTEVGAARSLTSLDLEVVGLPGQTNEQLHHQAEAHHEGELFYLAYLGLHGLDHGLSNESVHFDDRLEKNLHVCDPVRIQWHE